ncbi:MAG: EH signature domain-containing protein [Polyangiaceae bacterium]|nr:EH signature domain-containing protein [Polyangiaceae bacterium]
MDPLRLLSQMKTRVQGALSAHAAVWESLQRSRKNLDSHLTASLEKQDLVSAKHQERATQDLMQRVETLVLAGDFASLSRRELRVATNLLQTISPATMGALLRVRPEAHGWLVDSFFSHWSQLSEDPTREEWAELVRAAPPGVRVIHRGLNAWLITAKDGHRDVALSPPRTLAEFTNYLYQTLGCRRNWEFTHAATAEWLANALACRSWENIAAELAPFSSAIKPTLPALNGSTWVENWPPGGGGIAPLRSQVTVVAAMLANCNSHSSPASSRLVDLLLKSAFGDPRVPPMSNAWSEVRIQNPAAFDEFIAILVREDLSLFFRHAMKEEDRERFWLRYLPSIRGTQCVLASSAYSSLQRTLNGTETGRAVLSRAIRGTGEGASAFCMFFEKIVVVEFSETGNAAYVYQRAAFEQHVLPILRSRNVSARLDLKRTDLAAMKILHGTNWTRRAKAALARHGIFSAG